MSHPLLDLSFASVSNRLASLGSERWKIHFEARQRVLAGEDLIELTIGEPDIPAPQHLLDTAYQSMCSGRTGYAGGRGEPNLLQTLAEQYSKRCGRTVSQENVLALPGTQAALTICMMTLVEEGDAVLVPDPYYATYESVVRTAGAEFIAVPMDRDNGFHLTAAQLEAAITPNSKVLLLNSPHNPTGAVLNKQEIAAIGAVCKKHNLWIVSDEVYETLIYDGDFASPFDDETLAEQTIVACSISKSHAVPGFRSGWCVGPEWILDRAQSVAEAILFGNQPFIADMTVAALTSPATTAATMRQLYQRRIALLEEIFSPCDCLDVLRPAAGMFMLVDVHKTGMDGFCFAQRLLDYGVGVMPGNSFGDQAHSFIRISLTVDDKDLAKAAKRIVDCAEKTTQK